MLLDYFLPFQTGQPLKLHFQYGLSLNGGQFKFAYQAILGFFNCLG